MSAESFKDAPLERFFTPQEVAEMWKLDPTTIRDLFRDEPGVLKIGERGRRRKRDYVTLRIPESVLVRVYQSRAR